MFRKGEENEKKVSKSFCWLWEGRQKASGNFGCFGSESLSLFVSK